MFEDKVILITGGTGSLGKKLCSKLLSDFNPKKVIILSRDEMKQWEMEKSLGLDPRVRFLLGDVRDKDRLRRAFAGVDFVIHAAATKIVPKAEYDPFECIKTNILGAMNVVDAAIDEGVDRVVALSTDKASSPVNLYGATKLVSDKIFISANNYSSGVATKFSVVRYGNVMGSRGSVIPFFDGLPEDAEVPVTSEEMTRFMVTLDQAADLVLFAFCDMQGSELYIKKIPSMNILDIAKAVRPNGKIKLTGIRPGEKLHEEMISKQETGYVFEYADHFKILPDTMLKEIALSRRKDGIWKKSDLDYSSNTNTELMSCEALADWVAKNRSTFEKF